MGFFRVRALVDGNDASGVGRGPRVAKGPALVESKRHDSAHDVVEEAPAAGEEKGETEVAKDLYKETGQPVFLHFRDGRVETQANKEKREKLNEAVVKALARNKRMTKSAALINVQFANALRRVNRGLVKARQQWVRPKKGSLSLSLCFATRLGLRGTPFSPLWVERHPLSFPFQLTRSCVFVVAKDWVSLKRRWVALTAEWQNLSSDGGLFSIYDIFALGDP